MSATSLPRDATDATRFLAAAWAAVDRALASFLADRRAELVAMDAAAVELVDEIRRLVDAGGKRVRPLLCVLGARAGGVDPDDVVVSAAAALELLHTFALIHDDVMDDASDRRGVETTHVRFAGTGRGVAIAVLVGDLAAVLAEQRLRTCGADGVRLDLALGRFDRMRVEMAAGQFLDVTGGTAGDPRVAALKTSSYTAEGPVLIGAALAGAGPAVEGPLRVYARHLGEAFQLGDDLLDGELDARVARSRVRDLIDRAVDALAGAPIDAVALEALRAIAAGVAERGSG